MQGLSRLEQWYSARCNGLWEHQWGVDIGTLDNPGWTLDIDLWETSAQDRVLERVRIERSKNDWISYWVEKNKFHAAMGPRNLTECIDIFCNWFEGLA